MLQPMREEPPLNFKCKDKFLIQSTLITVEKEHVPLADLWTTPDAGSEEARVHQQKLRVTYLPPEGETLEEEDESQLQQSHLHPSSIINGDDRYTTAHKPAANARQFEPIPEFPQDDATTVAPPSPKKEPAPIPKVERSPTPSYEQLPEEVPAPRTQHREEPAHVPIIVPQPTISPGSLAGHAPAIHNQELEAKLESAQAEIERLRALLASVPASSPAPPPSMSLRTGFTETTGVRHRNRGLTDDGSTIIAESDVGTTVMDDSHLQPEGVPLQVVVVIAVGIFITTYLFF
jgi:vesicle-associated membrane protein-associated protein A